MAINGADIEQLRSLSRKFGTDATQLKSLIDSLNTATSSSSSYWTGKNADGFRRDWESLKPSFLKFHTLLMDAQKATTAQASRIDEATNH